MHLSEIQDFISSIHQKLVAQHGEQSQDRAVLMSMVKISEEVGELSEAILHSFGRQRAEKIDKLAAKDMSHEMADVILATCMLAQQLDIDITVALQEKMAKITTRFQA